MSLGRIYCIIVLRAPSWGLSHSYSSAPAWLPPAVFPLGAQPHLAMLRALSRLAPPLLPHLSSRMGPGRLPTHSLQIAGRSSSLLLPPVPGHASSLQPGFADSAATASSLRVLSCGVLLRLPPLCSRLEPAAHSRLPHAWGNATPRRVSARSLLFDSQALSDPISRSSCGLGLDPPWAASDCYRSCCVVDGSGIVAFTAPSTLDPCCLRWLRLLVPSLGALRFQATADQTSVRT